MLVTLEHVSYSYPRSAARALDDISLEIAEGEFVVLMGENGAGKTTFCKLFNGCIPHSQGGELTGTVTLDGLVTARTPPGVLAGRVGMVLDDPETQLFTASVRDEAAFGPENLLMAPREIEERVARALEITGLAACADVPPASLSGGQKQRLAIAAALAQADRVLVLDEPTAHLDPAGAREVLALIVRIRALRRMAVIMATHNSEEAAECADTLCVLKNGRLAARGTPGEIFGDGALLRDNGIRPPDVSALARYLEGRGESLPLFPARLGEAAAALIAWLGSGA